MSDAAPSVAEGGAEGVAEAVAQGAMARIHAIEPRSRANGPGARYVIWFQGCTLGCAGCFNPSTHADSGGQLRPVSELLRELAAVVRAEASGGSEADAAGAAGGASESKASARPAPRIEGLTLSGGEPMQQAEAAAELLAGARALGLSTLVFSGYTREEIAALPHGPEALASIDVLVDGRYRSTERLGEGLRGSRNQRILLLSERYTMADVEATPVAEIRIARDGQLVLTGVNPLKIKR